VKWISERRWRPSPAMFVALIALFVSLSGVSYGVATGFIDSREIKNNTIRTRDLRNNEIRTRDLRNNEVRGIDVRNSTIQSPDIALNAVTGADAKEETFGKVPSAAASDTATSAGSVSTLKIIPVRTVAEDASAVALASHGPLTLWGECDTGTVAELSVSTTENDSAAAGSGLRESDLDTAGGRFTIATANTMGGAREYLVSPVSAFARSGSGFSGEVGVYRDPAAGSCRFHGSVTLQG
jgi:hypothetical protein